MEKIFSCKNEEKKTAESIWLNYFNRYLFEHRIISQEEYNKMVDKISKNK
jgi:hypothetical protein